MARPVVEMVSMTPEEAERLRELEQQHAVHESECASQHKAFLLRLTRVEMILWLNVAGWFVMMAAIMGKDTTVAIAIIKALVK